MKLMSKMASPFILNILSNWQSVFSSKIERLLKSISLELLCVGWLEVVSKAGQPRQTKQHLHHQKLSNLKKPF